VHRPVGAPDGSIIVGLDKQDAASLGLHRSARMLGNRRPEAGRRRIPPGRRKIPPWVSLSALRPALVRGTE
jgi:hypothetical protein